jgi:hypothetical protein
MFPAKAMRIPNKINFSGESNDQIITYGIPVVGGFALPRRRGHGHKQA